MLMWAMLPPGTMWMWVARVPPEALMMFRSVLLLRFVSAFMVLW